MQLADELAKIHATPIERVPALGEARFELIVGELDDVGEPHPAIDSVSGGSASTGRRRARRSSPTATSGSATSSSASTRGWSASSTGSSRTSTSRCATSPSAWCARGASASTTSGWAASATRLPYLERYNELTGFDVRPDELDYRELAGNVAWAICCLTQAQRHLSAQDRSVELAILGRLGAEVEYEICHLLEELQ